MEENKKALEYTDIWSVKNEVIQKNNESKHNTNNIPLETAISENITGLVINSVGNIVSRFNFFIDEKTEESVNIKISPNGFMASIYNKPTNILVGYGHPLYFSGIVDPKQATILRLGPDQTKGDDVIISIANDKKLIESGLVCIIRSDDVLVDVLDDDIKNDFDESMFEAQEQITDMNELETSYNNYMKFVYTLLSDYSVKENNEASNITEEHKVTQ